MHSVEKIQKWMKDCKKDVFLINNTDEFLSEYVAPYAERLNWISNFTGSAGRAIIEKNKAYIFIDGRYTNQANLEVDTNYFEIKHLKDYWSHLIKYKEKNKIISLDPLLHSIEEVKKIKDIFKDSLASLIFLDINPVDSCWKDQPLKPNSNVFLHEIKYSGETALVKIKRIQDQLRLNFIDLYLLSSLDSIAWLLNIRGSDNENTPLVCCYAIVPRRGKIELFVNNKNFKYPPKEINNIVNINLIETIDNYIKVIHKFLFFGMDEKLTAYHFKNLCIAKSITTKNFENPCLYPKAIKNKTELRGAKKANLRDGVSFTKYLYWLKNKMKINATDEIKAADYLLNLRKKNELYFSPSFDTISAFGHHAALPHYRVTKESNLSFKNNSIYLVDSGAQYRDGTTDITRTIIIGNPTEEQKDRFTRVLKGHIAIAEAIFPVNTRGSQLDPLARKSLQEINCDYDHGTGHGIGSFLNVHEGPQRIAKSLADNDGLMKEGMIISNEPGYYKEGEYGIRIENLLIIRFKKFKNLDLLRFETISFSPIDRDLIDISLLNKNEIKWLNNYHKKVYKILSPYLNSNEKKWLHSVTNLIKV